MSRKAPFVCETLMKKVNKMNESGEKRPIQTRSRASTVYPEFVGHTFKVHNGKQYITVHVVEDMIGCKLGEFSPTRTYRGHGKDKK